MTQGQLNSTQRQQREVVIWKKDNMKNYNTLIDLEWQELVKHFHWQKHKSENVIVGIKMSWFSRTKKDMRNCTPNIKNGRKSTWVLSACQLEKTVCEYPDLVAERSRGRKKQKQKKETESSNSKYRENGGHYSCIKICV